MTELQHALIIEDDAESASLLMELLKMNGFECTILYDSRRVFETLMELPQLDVIFIDLDMPAVDGYSVLDMLRADEVLAQIPSVAYTSHLHEMTHARSAGFHSFLGKPLRGAAFREQLGRILRGQPVWEVR